MRGNIQEMSILFLDLNGTYFLYILNFFSVRHLSVPSELL